MSIKYSDNSGDIRRLGLRQGGFALIEVIVGVGVMATLSAAFLGLLLQAQKVSRLNGRELQASLSARELIEISKDLEQSNWPELVDNAACVSPGTCYPVPSGSAWTLAAGEEPLSGSASITRSLSVYPVFRDQLTFPNNIVSTGGVQDPDTRRVVATVSWNDGFADRTATLETYVYQLP